MRRLEERAIHHYGIPVFVLMDHAGKAVAETVRKLLSTKRGTIGVVCGGGNNGGDGVVAARWLKGWGYDVEVLWLKDPREWKGSAALHYSIARRMGVRFRPLRTRLRGRHSILIDALLGTGPIGELRESYRQAIDWINRQRRPVVAVDIPSGLDADTGRPLGAVVKARVTVTMAAPKKGLRARASCPFVGTLVVADIGIPTTDVDR
jgi:hydroxyethylthiazole kinase-like uncharacterized protein yjeF